MEKKKINLNAVVYPVIIIMQIMCLYIMHGLNNTVPKPVLYVCMSIGFLILCIYFEGIELCTGNGVKIIVILLCISTLILYDSFMGGFICVTLLLYVCFGKRFRILMKLATPLFIIMVMFWGIQITKVLSLRYKDFSFMNYLMEKIFRLIGVDTGIANDFLVVNMGGKSMRLLLTAEALCISVYVIWFVVIWTFMVNRDLKNFFKLLIMSFIYMILRYCIAVIIYNYSQNLNILWDMIPTIISFLPLSIITYFLLPPQSDRRKKDLTINNKQFAIYSAIWVGIGLLILGHQIGSLGKAKEGRLLIDEWHSAGWESSTEPLNTIDYGGQKTVYTYTSMVELLKKSYDVTIGSDETVINQIDNYDVLILKTPTKSFTTQEIKKIKRFINSGGGVFFIGDHTNLFNMSGNFNEIIRDYGITFEYDAVYDVSNGEFITTRNNNLINSPAMSAVEKYKFATSCSLDIDLGARVEMSISNGCAEKMDISTVNFFWKHDSRT